MYEKMSHVLLGTVLGCIGGALICMYVYMRLVPSLHLAVDCGIICTIGAIWAFYCCWICLGHAQRELDPDRR